MRSAMMNNPRRAIQKNFQYSLSANKHRARSTRNYSLMGNAYAWRSTRARLSPESQQKALFVDTTVQTSSIKLKTYTGEQMPVVGQMPVSVQYGEQTADLVLIWRWSQPARTELVKTPTARLEKHRKNHHGETYQPQPTPC